MNAEPQVIPVVMEMLEEAGWINCGQAAMIWGGQGDRVLAWLFKDNFDIISRGHDVRGNRGAPPILLTHHF